MKNRPVFVYGILKGRHEAQTAFVPQYRLIDMGWFPAAIPAGFDDKIKGELIYVDEDEIEEFDRIEGTPTFYTREMVSVELVGKDKVEAEMYVINRDHWPTESESTDRLTINAVGTGFVANVYEYYPE